MKNKLMNEKELIEQIEKYENLIESLEDNFIGHRFTIQRYCDIITDYENQLSEISQGRG